MRSFLTRTFVALATLAATSLALSAPAHAFDVEEFETNAGEWTFAPAKIGRSTVDGWAVVSVDGERALQPQPTPTASTYYWTLSREVDLTNVPDPLLDVKSQFLGNGYDLATFQVGPVGATRAADFTTLLQYTNALTSPEEQMLDLARWAGQKIQLRVQVRKPYGSVTSRPGFNLHRIGVRRAVDLLPPPPDPEILSIGSFNVQVFGLTKLDRVGVPAALVGIVGRYDLLLIQEIRDKTGTAITKLLDQVNAAYPTDPYALVISDRLGRTTSKEQYAYLYRPSALTVVDQYHFDDGIEPSADLFEREPFIVRFETFNGADFAAVALHAAPEDVPEEMAALADVIDDVSTRWAEDDILTMGDFNADCTYLSPAQEATLEIVTNPAVRWWIGDDADTTTTTTVCAYDRILTTGTVTDIAVPGSGNVFYFDQALQLSPTLTRSVSDHYPVEFLVDVSRLAR